MAFQSARVTRACRAAVMEGVVARAADDSIVAGAGCRAGIVARAEEGQPVDVRAFQGEADVAGFRDLDE